MTPPTITHCRSVWHAYAMPQILPPFKICLIRGKNCLHFASTWFRPGFWWGPYSWSWFILIFFCICLLFCLFDFDRLSSVPVYPMLTVDLYCPFLIAPSVFSNVYFKPFCCQLSWRYATIMHLSIHIGENMNDKWYINVRETRSGKLEWTFWQNLEQDAEHR